jgi:hypothetical protein
VPPSPPPTHGVYNSGNLSSPDPLVNKGPKSATRPRVRRMADRGPGGGGGGARLGTGKSLTFFLQCTDVPAPPGPKFEMEGKSEKRGLFFTGLRQRLQYKYGDEYFCTVRAEQTTRFCLFGKPKADKSFERQIKLQQSARGQRHTLKCIICT